MQWFSSKKSGNSRLHNSWKSVFVVDFDLIYFLCNSVAFMLINLNFLFMSSNLVFSWYHELESLYQNQVWNITKLFIDIDFPKFYNEDLMKNAHLLYRSIYHLWTNLNFCNETISVFCLMTDNALNEWTPWL